MQIHSLVCLGLVGCCILCVCLGASASVKAERGKYPFYAVVRYRNVPSCGATIVNYEYVLTAASCVAHDPFQRNGRFKVTVGETRLTKKQRSEQQTFVVDIILHGNGGANNELALLRLMRKLDYTKHVQPVQFENDTHAVNLKDCFQIGFGLGSADVGGSGTSSRLQVVDTTVISRRKCLTLNKSLLGGRTSDIKIHYICSQDQDAGSCTGDKGAPLICNHEDGSLAQAGVLSFGSQCIDGFNVFMRINLYREWIDDVTSKVWKDF